MYDILMIDQQTDGQQYTTICPIINDGHKTINCISAKKTDESFKQIEGNYQHLLWVENVQLGGYILM